MEAKTITELYDGVYNKQDKEFRLFMDKMLKSYLEIDKLVLAKANILTQFYIDDLAAARELNKNKDNAN